MASCLRAAAVAAAVVAPLLWQARASEVCSSAEAAQGPGLLQRGAAFARRGDAGAEARRSGSGAVAEARRSGVGGERAGAESSERIVSSDTWCYEKESALFGNCWAAKPNASVPPPWCTVDSGMATCRCSDAICAIDQLQATPPATGRCKERWIYVPKGVQHKRANGNGTLAVTGAGEEVYCKDMVKNDQWKEKHLVKLPGDPPAVNSYDWWSCWPPNTWWDGRCYRKTRYLGESCWDGSRGGGVCAGSEKSYKEHATSCFRGTCVPFAWATGRTSCSCRWFGWNFIVACSAAENACGGHACLLNMADGKKYCDWASSQDW